MPHSADRQMTLSGIVCPAEWDDLGNVTGVKILTYDEQEFLIAEDGVGRELLQTLHEFVRLSGRCVKTPRGRRLVHVSDYRVLNV